MEQLKLLIEKVGSKDSVAKMLSVTVRYIDLILDGKKIPGKVMMKLIRIYLVAYMD